MVVAEDRVRAAAARVLRRRGRIVGHGPGRTAGGGRKRNRTQFVEQEDGMQRRKRFDIKYHGWEVVWLPVAVISLTPYRARNRDPNARALKFHPHFHSPSANNGWPCIHGASRVSSLP